jgi:DNA modification methylase
MSYRTSTPVGSRSNNQNQLLPDDRGVHDWYRFVLSFPPHLVRTYIEQFGIDSSQVVLDPFCGAGTTLVEAKKSGIASVGMDSHPMAHFASSVKVDWSVSPDRILAYAGQVAESFGSAMENAERTELSDVNRKLQSDDLLFGLLSPEESKLLIKNSISPRPVLKAITLLSKIDEHGDASLRNIGRLALAGALVNGVSNLKFGPEVGVGRVKADAPVLESWGERIQRMADDLRFVHDRSEVPARVIKFDSRNMYRALEPRSVHAVITSPPYPNEKDYTRTTRLESVMLGLINNRHELRQVKQDLLRSNTRGVYKDDTDDESIASFQSIVSIADAIECRRIELGKTSGFERLYARVTKLYFGGMLKHLASLRTVLRPGAKLAYVVGDQASFLRVMIPTGQIISDIADSLGYRVIGRDLFRTRFSTVTGQHLREEVVVMEWPNS